jgi:uncharacterized protein (TIGR02266 family)
LAESHTRQAKRTPVTLKIKFKSATLDQFIERYSVDVSHGGIFIRTKDPLPVGTAMRFEFQLKDASPLITGEGTVVWTREHDPSRAGVAPGMGVRFDRLADGSQEVLDKILAGKAAKGRTSKAPVFNEVPTRVAPSPLVAGLAKESEKKLGNLAPPRGSFGDERTDATPLPTPMPFHSDLDDFPDEAFEEATKVRSLDELVAQSAISDDDAADLFGRARPVAPAPEPEPEPVPEPVPATKPMKDELAARRAAKEAATTPEAEDEADKAEAKKAEPKKAEAKKAEPKAKAVPKKRMSSERSVRTQKVDTRTEPKEKKAVAARMTPTEEPSSGGFLKFAVAAILLCAVGAGGYYMYTKSQEGDKVAKSDKADNNAAAKAAKDQAKTDQATKDVKSATAAKDTEPPKQPEPEVPTVDHLVPATDGANIELSDGSQGGPAPFTFAGLEEGKEYTARVTLSGHVAQEISFVAGKAETPQVDLVAMERVLRVTSTPPGAIVYINKIRQPGLAPMDIKLVGRLKNKPRYKISMRMAGHQKLNQFVETGDDAFSEDTNLMVASFEGALKKKVVVANRPPRNDPPKDDPPKNDPPPKDDPPKNDPPPKDDPPKNDPPPKDDPPKNDPPPEPKNDPPPKDNEPTPDWMKNP